MLQRKRGKIIRKTDVFTSTTTDIRAVPQSKSPQRSFGYLHLSNVWNAASFSLTVGVCVCVVFQSWLCVCVYMQLRSNPKSHVIFWAWGRREDAKKWNVMTSGCVWERRGGEDAFFAVCVCALSYDQECTCVCECVWVEGILPDVFFPLPVSPPPPPPLLILQAGSAGFGLGERSDRLEEPPVFPLSLCFHHSLNVTINPVHTHKTFPHLSIQCVCLCVSHMTWQKWTMSVCVCVCVCASARMCVLRVFGSFLNGSLTKKIRWEMWVLNAPSLSFLFSFPSSLHFTMTSPQPLLSLSFFSNSSLFSLSTHPTCGGPLRFSISLRWLQSFLFFFFSSY